MDGGMSGGDIGGARGTKSRREAILGLIAAEGGVRVSSLSELFGISGVTIRTDLEALEKKGLLERVHGGAVGTYKSYLSLPLTDRLNVNGAEKRRIALALAEIISEGESVIFNAGSTTLLCARETFKKQGISIVTNSIVIAGEARLNKVERVILLGGMLDGEFQFTYGDDTINHIRKYRADKFVMSLDGICAGEGITTHHYSEVETTRAMMDRANQIIAVADSSKIGRTGFASICPVDAIDLLITGRESPARQLNEIAAKGVLIKRV
ncbi:MAG: DeoR/GlpR transcriptional regulator [Clostridia bacterium]|nr:DeoR/GlpR transcriptional regulator [Clostridia bacterium]